MCTGDDNSESEVDRFEFLEKLLSRQTEMLRFAEAKNGALLAASMGGIALFSQVWLKIFDEKIEYPIWLFAYSSLGLCFLAITICFCLHSFIPKYKTDAIEDDMTAGSRNLTYYGDIRRFSVSTFKSALLTKSDWRGNFSDLDQEYISQSIIISRITDRKMKLFTVGIYSFLFAVFTPFCGLVFILYNRYSDYLFKKIGLF